MKKETFAKKRSWAGLAAVAVISVGACASQPNLSDAARNQHVDELARPGGAAAMLVANSWSIPSEDAPSANCKTAQGLRTAADATLQLFIKRNFFNNLDTRNVCNLNPNPHGTFQSCLSDLSGKSLKLPSSGGTAPPALTPLDIDIHQLAVLNPHAGSGNGPIQTVDLIIALDTSGGNAAFVTTANDLAIDEDVDSSKAADDFTYLAIRAGARQANKFSCRTKSPDNATAGRSKITIRITTTPGGQPVNGYLNIAILLGKGVNSSATPKAGFYLPVIIDPKVPSDG